MKRKQIVSMLLVGAMAAALLAGCGSSNSDTSDAAASAGAEAATSAEAEESSDAATSSFTGFDEMQNITMYGMSFYGDAGLTEVMDAVNAISEEAINVHVEYTPMDVATYMEQIGLMLSGGEAFDLVQTTAIPVVSFSTMQSQNELTDITDLLAEYAPETLEMMQEYIGATTVDGKIYAVPNLRSYDSNQYLCMRKDVLDELGLTEQAQAIDSYSDMEEIMQAVKDAQDTLPDELQTKAVICNQDGQGAIITANGTAQSAEDWADHYGFDILGDSNKIIWVDPETDTVSNFFESDEYAAECELVNKWMDEGYVYKDAATAVETGDTLMANGVSFCSFLSAEYGVEATKGATIGKELVCVESCEIPIQTYAVSQWCWAVPTTSENPEAAVAFINLMWTNADIENLFAYGIEGRDYQILDSGEASYLDTKEYQCNDFLFGNQFNAHPLEGNGTTFREEAKESLEAAEVSKYLGFSVNTDPIANELTAVANVLNKYENALESGTIDTSNIQTMVDEMNSAGCPDVVAYYQDALNTWLAAQ